MAAAGDSKKTKRKKSWKKAFCGYSAFTVALLTILSSGLLTVVLFKIDANALSKFKCGKGFSLVGSRILDLNLDLDLDLDF